MLETFQALTDEPRPRMGQVHLVFGVFLALPGVIMAEWWDELRGAVRDSKTGGLGMGWRQWRFAIRTLRKAPAFAGTTVGLIALGVGAVTTMFTLVDHVLLRPLPYPEPDRLVTVENGSHSGPFWNQLQAVNSVEQWAGAFSQSANLIGESDPLRIEQADISEDFFEIFGARPALGRLFLGDDFAAPSTVVLSHGTWVRVFGEDPGIVGRSIRVDQDRVTVIGVLTEDFALPQALVGSQIDAWRPIDFTRRELQSVDYSMMEVVGRVSPGAGVPDVQAEIDDLSLRMAALYPGDMVDRDGNPYDFPVVGLQASTVQRVRGGLTLLLGAVAMLLLVACLNVAHLFLARGLGRVQEMAIRRALGAGAGGLVRQLFVESLLIGALGGLLGTLLAAGGLRLFLLLNPEALPTVQNVSIDLRVLAFAALISVLTAVVFGLLPALRTLGRDLTVDLKGSSRGSTAGPGTGRLRSGLVVAEVALSLMLVAQAGLLLKSFLQVQAHDPGVDVEGVWTLPMTPTGIETPAEYVAMMNEIESSLAAVPGVASATYGLTMPFQYTGGGRCCWGRTLDDPDGGEQDIRLTMHPVSDGYFETLGLELVAGAPWGLSEAELSPAPGIVTEALAVRMYGGAEAALGQVLDDSGDGWRIVGVARDAKHYGLDQSDPLALYVPMAAVPFAMPGVHMAVKLAGTAPAELAGDLRRAVWRVAPDLPVPTVRPLAEWVEASTAGRRFDSVVFMVFGGVALLLAAAGLYGTLLYGVRQRRRELGIRLALGASRNRVERQVVGDGIRLALLGLGVGLLGAWNAGRVLESRLFGVEARDLTTLLGAALVLFATALLASWLPARRAGRTDPIQTLKAE